MRLLLVAAAFAAVALLGTRAASAADAFTLVSNDDVAAEHLFEAKPNNNEPHAAERSLGVPPPNSNALPLIQVLSPQPSNESIASPIRIQLTFKTSADAHVVPASFKVLYGLLKIDITDKLRPYATVTETGLVADNAAVPTGNHRLFLEISDTAGRTAVRELNFTIAK